MIMFGLTMDFPNCNVSVKVYIISHPMADTSNSKAEDDMKSRWVPPNSVHGKDYYQSSVLNKDGYL